MCKDKHFCRNKRLFPIIICNFAAVNRKNRRHIASLVLLAVFLPMLILSSVHVHEVPASVDYECSGCVQHHCHGHIAESAASIHACVLCQFVSLPYLIAATILLPVILQTQTSSIVEPSAQLQSAACRYHSPRAPPVLSE